jgi:hypothetical protein
VAASAATRTIFAPVLIAFSEPRIIALAMASDQPLVEIFSISFLSSRLRSLGTFRISVTILEAKIQRNGRR